MPIAVTKLCMAPHQQYQQSGRLRVRMEDGTEVEAGHAETAAVPQDTTPGSWAAAGPTFPGIRRGGAVLGQAARFGRAARISSAAPTAGTP